MTHQKTKPVVGIITLTQAENYGTVLQAYATLKIFQSLTDELEFSLVPTDWRYTRWRDFLKMAVPREGRNPIRRFRNYRRMREFIDPFLGNDADYLNIGNARAVLTFLRANYDGLITGSDEIWNMRYKGADQVYLLTPDIRMYHAAYATSANRLNFTNLDIDGKRRMGEALLAYDRIYVRDGNTANVVDTLTGSCIRQSRIIDPTITYEFAELRRDVPARGGNSPRKKRILVMASSHFVVDQLLNKFGHEAEIHSIFIGHRGTTFIDADPVQFLNMFKDYDVIVSQFFHGVCMSIKSGRPFVGFDLAADYPNVESKIKSILTLLDLSSNYHRLTDKDAISIVNHVSEALDGGRNIPASVKLRVDAERTQAWDAAKQIVDDLHARLAAHSL